MGTGGKQCNTNLRVHLVECARCPGALLISWTTPLLLVFGGRQCLPSCAVYGSSGSPNNETKPQIRAGTSMPSSPLRQLASCCTR